MADRRGVLAAFLLLACGCAGYDREAGPDCVPPPCPLPTAIVLNVTSVAGGPVADVSVSVSGAALGSGWCSVEHAATVCRLAGMPGTYGILLTAPGFQEKALSVTVAGSTPPCACARVQTRQLSVSLAPA